MQCAGQAPETRDFSPLTYGNGHRPLTEGEIREIVAIEEPVLRNLRITLGYHDLAVGMSELLGHANVSWPGFACWASRTAGSFIRGRFLPGVQLPALAEEFVAEIKPVHRPLHTAHRALSIISLEPPPRKSLLIGIVEQVAQKVVEHVSAGNRMVFKSIAPIYARMIATFRGDTHYDEAKIARFLDQLVPGPVEEGGQELLIGAFGNYYEAIFETDSKKKAELILLANNRAGLHEQSRLDSHIKRAMNAPLAPPITHAARQRARELTHRWLHSWVDQQVERVMPIVTHRIQTEWQRILTKWFMRLELPDNLLKLRKPTPPIDRRSSFPCELEKLDNIELKALLYDLDNSPNEIESNGAKNWADLSDRMNYLVDLFRTRQQDELLYGQPFTDYQVARLRKNQIPRGI